MLTEQDVRAQLADAAGHIGDDPNRAARAIAAGDRRTTRRQRSRAVVAAAAVGVTAVVVPTLLTRSHHPAAPPTAATIACQQGRTVVNTPRVTALSSGAVVTINNETQRSVVVRLGNETAVVAPGVIEGQFPLSPGRQTIQCMSGGTASPAASIAVVAARGI